MNHIYGAVDPQTGTVHYNIFSGPAPYLQPLLSMGFEIMTEKEIFERDFNCTTKECKSLSLFQDNLTQNNMLDVSWLYMNQTWQRPVMVGDTLYWK